MSRNMNWIFSILLCCIVEEINVSAYKPVVIVHGILSGSISMIPMADRIKQFHPGTEVYVTNKYSFWSSLEPMWQQVKDVGEDIMQLASQHPEGINLIGYSQGGLVARGILEQFSDHNVHTFISLSAPQGGQFGTKFLHLFFPGLVCHNAYELFYSGMGQHISVANYWNDPHHQGLYLNYSLYLPYINNELISAQSSSFKKGITKLKKLVLIGGPDDGVITPWESSHFGFLNEDEKVVDIRKQPAYINDTFGLKTLDKKKKLVLIEQNGVTHIAWHMNMTVIDNYIIPYLT